MADYFGRGVFNKVSDLVFRIKPHSLVWFSLSYHGDVNVVFDLGDRADGYRFARTHCSGRSRCAERQVTPLGCSTLPSHERRYALRNIIINDNSMIYSRSNYYANMSHPSPVLDYLERSTHQIHVHHGQASLVCKYIMELVDRIKSNLDN